MKRITRTSKKTAILLSGGVDSLTAAFLLKKKGCDLVGIHFVTGFEPLDAEVRAGGDPWPEIRETAHRSADRLAGQLHIPVVVYDCRRDFKTVVVDYFVTSYAQGLTPNPCLVCNPAVKFGSVFDFARSLGAERLATGHYARKAQNTTGIYRLLTGKDALKDQSYFLARLTQKDLARALFPLGEMTKTETVKMARENSLKPLTPGESQDVCFIRRGRYGEFLENQPGFNASPGNITDVDGNVIGTHPGLHLFTIGQRRGINCPAPQAYYVIDMDAHTHTLTVGPKRATQSISCRVAGINWIGSPPAGRLNVRTRVRYRHRAARSRLSPITPQSAHVRFEKPQTAITPGQGAVFYDGEEVLGGGWIVKE
jgi:tRNA-specific 2-thiouridylase